MNERKAGILLSYINFAINSFIMLLYVPMLLHYVSKEQYGIYQMVGSFIGVMSIFDFGLCVTVTRFLSRAKAVNDLPQERNIIHTAGTLYALLTVGLLILGTGLYFLITPVYGASLSAADLKTAQQIYLILLLNFAICLPGNLYVAVLQANERFVFRQTLFLISTFLSPLVIWGALVWKANVVCVVWGQTTFNILITVANYIYCKTKLQFRFAFAWKDKALIKQLMGFSFFLFIGSVAGQLYSRLGPLVLGVLSGALAVANYYIATQILMVFSVVPSLVNSVFLPKLSGDWITTASLESQNDIFCKTGRLQALVALLILVGFVLLGRPFLALWLGPGNEICYGLAVIIMTASVVNIVQSAAETILIAMNRYKTYAFISLSVAFLNVGVAFPLIAKYSTVGCAVSFALCVGVINGILMNRYYHRVGLDLRAFFKELLPIAEGSVAAFGILVGVWLVWPVAYTWGSFFCHGIFVVAVYSVIMALCVLNRFEWDILREIANKCGIRWTK